ncbi:MAG: signal peptide peptidase SppA [Clostridia bacterium]|jgi:protease-4|nr:signal peptide peptidase SppA [Clostridia bacterium]MDH7571981.1 signal peptide peptidase SppA [Clostridia bacterium]
MRKGWLGGLIIVVAVVVVWLATLWLSPRGEGRATGGEVGLVRIEGTIVDGRETGGIFGAMSGAETISEQLHEARRDPRIRAVVLRINSPGGSAAACHEIAAALGALRGDGKPVVAFLGETAASGAYWLASQADRIVATPATLTGSIGVIMELQNLRGLMDKLGIQVEVIKSGAHKDMGAGWRALTSEERRLLQDMVDDIYRQFVQVVSEGRGLPEAKVLELADGSLFTGRQALEKGLVDELGDYELALRRARELAGLPAGAPVRALARPSPWEWLRSSLDTAYSDRYRLFAPGLWLIAPALVPWEGGGA